LAQRLGLLLVPDEVFRTGATGCLRLLGVHGDLFDLDLDVGEILGSGATLDVDSGLDSR
jgi:glutamate-1-semialdehyde aminotransferase